MNVCGLCEEQLEHGYLCPGCARATTDRLDRLPKLWAALAEFLAPGSGASAQYGRTRVAEAPLPVRENVLNFRAAGGIAGVLEDWHTAMHADRGWRPPVAPAAVDQRVSAAARALRLNMYWIADFWPQAEAFATEVRALEGDVLSIVDPEDPDERRQQHGTRIGLCVAQFEDSADAEDPEVCGAVLRSYPGEAMLTCRWCLTEYGPEDYLMLKAFQPAA